MLVIFFFVVAINIEDSSTEQNQTLLNSTQTSNARKFFPVTFLQVLGFFMC